MKYKKFSIRLLQFYIALILVQISTQTIHSIEQSDYKNQTKVQSKSPLSLASLKVSSLAASAAAAAATATAQSSQSLKSNKNRQHDDLFPFANSHIRLATNFNTSIFAQSTSTARAAAAAAAAAAGAPATHSATASPTVSTSTSVSSSASAYASTPRSFAKKKLHGQQSSKSNITTRDTLSQKASEHEPVIFIPETRLPPIHHNNYAPSLKNNKNSIGGFNGQKSSIDWKSNGSEAWDRQYRKVRYSNIKVQHIEAECQDDFMKIRVGFNGSFTGLLYSSGYAYDPDCMYINGTGRDYYEFYIQLNRCGTLGKNNHHEDNRKTPTKNYMWNTVTVQYNPLIEEEFDEHFKVTCEYGYDFWKTVSFPFLNVEVATGNPVVFTLNPPECYMEIRYGYGTSGARVANAVRVGDPLTLMIYMRSKFDGFDIAVNNCYAHNGATKRILLINEFGCPVDDTLMSRFRGSFSESGLFETQVYAYMKAFRFTGSPALYIECDVRMCHGRCPSQTCHWRNIKTVRKRSIDESDMDAVAGSAASTNSTNPVFLSENINLFQSLQVLQDGESDDELTPYDSRKATAAKSTSLPSTAGLNGTQTLASNLVMDPYSVCMKTGVFSAVLACGVGLVCLLSGALLTTCSRLKKNSKFEKSMFGSFDGYISHKNRIH